MKELEKVLFKETKKKRLTAAVACLVAAVVLILVGGRIFLGYAFASKELNDYSASSLKNGYYKFTDVYELLGEYGYDDTGSGYVLIVRSKTDPSDFYLMGMYFDKKDIDVAEKVYNGFWDTYETGNNSYVYISGAGRVRDMKSDEKQVFQDALFETFKDSSSKSELESRMVYKTLEYKAFPRMMRVREWVMLISGVGLAVAAIFLFFTVSGGGSRKKILEQVAVSGVDPSILASELSYGKKHDNIVIGSKCIYVGGFSPKMFFFKDLVWVYGKVTNTQHKMYGVINTGTTTSYAINFLDRNNKATIIPLKNGAMNGIISDIHEAAPHIITGYSEDIANAAKNNFNAILDAVRRKKAEIEQAKNDEIANTPSGMAYNDSEKQSGGYDGYGSNNDTTGSYSTADVTGSYGTTGTGSSYGTADVTGSYGTTGTGSSYSTADVTGSYGTTGVGSSYGTADVTGSNGTAGSSGSYGMTDTTGAYGANSSYGDAAGKSTESAEADDNKDSYSDMGFGNTTDYGNINDFTNL
ncbi:MAG: hypothetical protein K6C35_08485 [Eubacterium sp.]|nr:hypothetical protein [Eubacterium sp.]